MMARPRPEEKQCRARVSGRVQGVGFRFFVEREAIRLGLKGWVRNLENGDVELVARGQARALDELLAKVSKGPALAWVADVNVEMQTPDPTLRSFAVKPTTW
jgi:acylphosphatase